MTTKASVIFYLLSPEFLDGLSHQVLRSTLCRLGMDGIRQHLITKGVASDEMVQDTELPGWCDVYTGTIDPVGELLEIVSEFEPDERHKVLLVTDDWELIGTEETDSTMVVSHALSAGCEAPTVRFESLAGMIGLWTPPKPPEGSDRPSITLAVETWGESRFVPEDDDRLRPSGDRIRSYTNPPEGSVQPPTIETIVYFLSPECVQALGEERLSAVFTTMGERGVFQIFILDCLDGKEGDIDEDFISSRTDRQMSVHSLPPTQWLPFFLGEDVEDKAHVLVCEALPEEVGDTPVMLISTDPNEDHAFDKLPEMIQMLVAPSEQPTTDPE